MPTGNASYPAPFGRAADPSLAGEAFNLSTVRPLSVPDLVGLIRKAAGTDLEPDIRATARHEIPHRFLSAAKARKLLGWQPPAHRGGGAGPGRWTGTGPP
jgi:nucleoside-diphosphate-sugar epimerase